MDAVPQFAEPESEMDYAIFDQPPAQQFSQPDQTPEVDVDEFPPDIHDDVVGMLSVGALTDTVTVAGSHRFIIRTLKGGEELAVRLIAAKYRIDPEAYDLARSLATMAAAIISIDGAPLATSLVRNSTTELIAQKFERLRDDYYPEALTPVFDAYTELKIRQARALDALEGKSRAGRISSTGSADSPTNRAFSEETSTTSSSEH